MPTRISDPTPWPDSLAWIIASLQRTKIQEIIETPMEKGPPKRRPRGTARDGFTGEVTLDETDWNALTDLYRTSLAFIVRAPDTGQPTVVAFTSAPFPRKTTIRDDLSTRVVQITLAEL